MNDPAVTARPVPGPATADRAAPDRANPDAAADNDDPRRLRVHRAPPRRDVPYVPSDAPVVSAMLRFAGVGPDDVVYDLGCGDGRIVIHAAKHFGCRGVGVDIDPQRIAESRENAAKARLGDRVRFLCQSFFDTDLRPASVVALYLLPQINVRLRPKLLSELRPGSRIVANNYDLGDWPADMRAEAHHRTLHQWIVPASVAGTWNCVVDGPDRRQRLILRLGRRYQTVTGTARLCGATGAAGRPPRDLQVLNGKLFGDEFTFKLIDYRRASSPTLRFACRVDGTVMRGTCQFDGPVAPSSVAWGGTWKGSNS